MIRIYVFIVLLSCLLFSCVESSIETKKLNYRYYRLNSTSNTKYYALERESDSTFLCYSGLDSTFSTFGRRADQVKKYVSNDTMYMEGSVILLYNQDSCVQLIDLFGNNKIIESCLVEKKEDLTINNLVIDKCLVYEIYDLSDGVDNYNMLVYFDINRKVIVRIEYFLRKSNILFIDELYSIE